jgi:hypothetical protein
MRFQRFGDRYQEARVNPTFEVWLRTEDVPVQRTHEQATGLDMLDLPDEVHRPPGAERL